MRHFLEKTLICSNGTPSHFRKVLGSEKASCELTESLLGFFGTMGFFRKEKKLIIFFKNWVFRCFE